MKILLTGMNAQQSTRKFYVYRSQLKITPAHYSLYNCLVDMGHEVEQRKVEIGEDLSHYDEVIVYIAGPRQLVATTVFNALWAISQRPDCILGVDDWQAPDLFKGIEKCQDWDELSAQFILDVNRTTLDEVSKHKNQYLQAVNTIASRKNRMLVCAFSTKHLGADFGPHLLFDAVKYPRDRIFTFNPNPYHRNRKPGDFFNEGAEDPTWNGEQVKPLVLIENIDVKQRRFNFASLVQSKTQKWLKKQGYTGNPKNDEEGTIGSWPVDLYGSKAETQKRLTEDQMCQIFQRDWGCLMPGYEHAGSGWWRARYQQCADAGCILIGEKKELMVIYNNIELSSVKAVELTDWSDTNLKEFARAQAEAIAKWHPLDKEKQKSELQAILSAAK